MASFLESLFSFSYSQLTVALLAGGVIFIITFFVVLGRPSGEGAKFFLLISILCIAIAATVYMVAATLYTINVSPTKGPVHWHADFRIFNCEEEIDLVDPNGFSNKVGTPLVHEHGDKRVHIEGIPEEESVASLKNFFMSIGGYFDSNTLRVLTNDGTIELKSESMCMDGKGVLQVFLWKTEGKITHQEKLFDPGNYIISGEQLVPPGDCIIIELDTEKTRTDHICEQYSVAEVRGDIIIESPKL